MKQIVLWVFFCFCTVPTSASGAFGLAPNGKLDIKTLSEAYEESEFEPVRVSVEKYLKQRGESATREEKIFAFKYLGVIYAADSSTRIRAESYFNRLLDLAPNIELIDMFVSHNIMEIFGRVKQERRKNDEYRQNFDAYGNPLKPKAKVEPALVVPRPKEKPNPPPRIEKENSSSNWLWWLAGGVAVGAGVGVYFLTQSMDSPGQGADTLSIGN